MQSTPLQPHALDAQQRAQQRAQQKKSQASVEYLAIVGFTLAALLIVWAYVSTSTSYSKQDLSVAYARQVVYRLRDASDLVYAQGPPAQFYVDVNVPEGILAASVGGANGKEIVLTLSVGGGVTEVFASTAGNVSGDLSKFVGAPGLYAVLVKAQEAGGGATVVNITA